MPARVIRGEINSSESLARVSIGADLCFRALLVAVDDWGRLDARIPILKGMLFPMRREVAAKQIVGWLVELTAGDDPPVTVYEVEGRPYLHLNGWEHHRGKGRRATVSKYPAPPVRTNTGLPRISEDFREIHGDPPEGRGTRDEKRGTRDEKREGRKASEDLVDSVWPDLVQAAKRHGKAWADSPGLNQRRIVAQRMKQGATPEQLVAAIHGARKRFSNMDDPTAYLTATTIYAPSKFDANVEAGQSCAPRASPAAQPALNPRFADLLDLEPEGTA